MKLGACPKGYLRLKLKPKQYKTPGEVSGGSGFAKIEKWKNSFDQQSSKTRETELPITPVFCYVM